MVFRKRQRCTLGARCLQPRRELLRRIRHRYWLKCRRTSESDDLMQAYFIKPLADSPLSRSNTEGAVGSDGRS